MIDGRVLRDGAAQLGIELSPAASARLIRFGELILKWNKVYNLTALRDPALVVTHHLLDSLAVIGPLRREGAGRSSLLDVGSGAGLPGVVIAAVEEELQVACVDAVAKKSAFVQQVAAELVLSNLRGVHARVETLDGSYDVISSRAFASLGDFVSKTSHLLAPNGKWMAMKGRVPTEEISQLDSEIDVFHVEQLVVPYLDAERCIVWARKAAH
ncbi:MAG: 16S rRNA (guanine(527)-N(7))-methyltransferase RsmG [Gammaproteobacteria bacterium]|nr:16S rRNA (guanine(527)-N(7))-methyltransferase RsmG [Gammaproteobacteria bacterium]MBU1443425.1 16S rRNA (guanine(527)-N(7))-methyltransferase RsmG [Gammaproteobacteria bacterium]MBU2288771.1 16S rRNA (guanine(527)-N(7))-methyltransferase RsmG [Gammaproteobacteria bacterium]MBU2409009.1 16S rRNA (guanine(527)-N(7))-methyltransferase RsmG [Gammaproteobacteria bacterium]